MLPTKQLELGLVYMFPGIEGGYWSLGEARRAFRDAGIDSAIYTHEWKYPFLWLGNLTDYSANRDAAQKAAERIVDYYSRYPGRPVDLVGYSGGGGLAVMTAEALPADVQVRHVILVHAAISPTYDLTGALKNIQGDLVNFYSPYDWFMLGLGTSVFGTIDSEHVAAAGQTGFDLDEAVSEDVLRPKVKQHEWSLEALRHGHLGGHLTIAFYQWNRDKVAKCLMP